MVHDTRIARNTKNNNVADEFLLFIFPNHNLQKGFQDHRLAIVEKHLMVLINLYQVIIFIILENGESMKNQTRLSQILHFKLKDVIFSVIFEDQ